MGVPRTYPATVTGVHDGDTCGLDVSLGFLIRLAVTVRLAAMNAQELALPGGKEARDHLLKLMPVGTPVTFTSISVDKYGSRVDGRIVLSGGVDVGAQMVADGYAAAWDGTGVRPVAPWPIPAHV